ncbi:nucleotide exchange factor GrpE [candidate division KSB1 bacterium]|nr:nucleotide exchange factor GrpE [candidate division KSB1 bacterium]
MQNEAYQTDNNHSDKPDERPVDSTAMPAEPASADLKTDDTPATEVEAGIAAETVTAEDTDSFEIPIEQENGDGAVLEMLAAEPAPADVALEPEKPKKEKFDFRRRTQAKELEQKERELARLQDDHAKLTSIHAELKDRYLRLAAEMENFRKRLERDFANRVESTMSGLLSELLPVVDDLERFLNARNDLEAGAKAVAGNETTDYDALVAGASLIYQNMLKILQNRGVTAMEAVGHEFDPNRHEAMMQMAVEGKAPNLVVQENNKGYLLRDKMLRPAKVVVSA